MTNNVFVRARCVAAAVVVVVRKGETADRMSRVQKKKREGKKKEADERIRNCTLYMTKTKTISIRLKSAKMKSIAVRRCCFCHFTRRDEDASLEEDE